MNKPRVSVIIPSYNHEAFIASAVQSVLDQTYAAVEVIVVDDGSHDRSLDVLRRFEHNAKVRVVRQVNEGAHAAINRGLVLANGEYCAILNSDDEYHPRRLERLTETIDGDGAEALAITDLNMIGAAGEPLQGQQTGLYAGLVASATGLEGSELFLVGNVAFTTSNLFFSRRLLERVGMFRNLRYTHDWDWVLRASECAAVRWLREPLLRYRIHGRNTIMEQNLWRHIAENAFVFAGLITRRRRFYQISVEEVMHNVLGLLVRNDSFLPLPVLLFAVLLLSGQDEAEVLRSLNNGELVAALEREFTASGLPMEMALSSKALSEQLRSRGSLRASRNMLQRLRQGWNRITSR